MHHRAQAGLEVEAGDVAPAIDRIVIEQKAANLVAAALRLRCELERHLGAQVDARQTRGWWRDGRRRRRIAERGAGLEPAQERVVLGVGERAIELILVAAL